MTVALRAETPLPAPTSPAETARILGRARDELLLPSSLGLVFIETPIGPMIAAATDEALWLVEFADRPELTAELLAVEKEAGQVLSLLANAGTEAITKQVGDYFAGDMNAFASQPVSYGTAFTASVHHALRAILPGQTISYKELATKVGRPTAFRAVARANAANRLAIIVPCHRVIASSGAVSGYAGGKWRKEWLLKHEARSVAST